MTIASRNRNWVTKFLKLMRNIICPSDRNRVALCLCFFVFLQGCSGGGDGSKWPTHPIESVIIVNAKNVWITTDKAELMYLGDGASPPEKVQDNVAAADFITKDIGWSVMKNGEIFRTSDGGIGWQRIGKVHRNIKGESPFWTQHRMMRFADENVGWIAVDSDSLFRTEDGGYTWKAFVPPKRGPHSPSQMVVVDRNEFWCVSWTGFVLYSFDAGGTWEVKELPSEKPGDESYPRAISRDGQGRIWVGNVLSKPVMYVSPDRGQAWEARTFAAEPGTIRVTSIQFAPDGVGRLVYRRIIETDQPIRSSMAMTTDAGETWNPVPLKVPFEPLRVEFLDSSVGFLIGRSEIAKTEDGGKTWTVIYKAKTGENASEGTKAGSSMKLPFKSSAPALGIDGML